MKTYFIHNHKFYKSEENTINVQSRGVRYGDGFFETIKAIKGSILLKELHFERIVKSAALLNFQFNKKLNIDSIELSINKLLIKNNHLNTSRIRLMFFGKNGGLYDEVNNTPEYAIETYAIDIENKLNSNGLILGIFTKAIKPCDEYSSIKSNNFLPYIMGAQFAKQNKLNDAIILNMHGRICDTTIANIFIVKNNQIFTPPLTEGCIAGVMRRNLIEKLKVKFPVLESSITMDDLKQADEVFLTNSIRGIRWVKTIGDFNYHNKITKEIYKFINTTI